MKTSQTTAQAISAAIQKLHPRTRNAATKPKAQMKFLKPKATIMPKSTPVQDSKVIIATKAGTVHKPGTRALKAILANGTNGEFKKWLNQSGFTAKQI